MDHGAIVRPTRSFAAGYKARLQPIGRVAASLDEEGQELPDPEAAPMLSRGPSAHGLRARHHALDPASAAAESWCR